MGVSPSSRRLRAMSRVLRGKALCAGCPWSLWLTLLVFLWPASTWALIHGETFPAQAISTLKINIQHAHFLHSTESWEYYDSVCSAIVVGVKPLTLITAAHCLREAKLGPADGLPDVSIAQADQLGLQGVKIRQTFYRPYEEVSEDITLDVAVLVFDAAVPENIQPLEIMQDETLPDELMICGYGRGYLEPDTRQPRCAERSIIQSVKDFTDILPAPYQLEDEMLHLKSRAQFEYTKELAHLDNVLLAVNRLNVNTSQYDQHLAMPTVGDSGGPWLALGPRGQYQLVAVTSLVERFYNKSPHWKFFERDVPLSDYPYIAYGLRLSHPVIISYLEYVKHSGADIRFARKESVYRSFTDQKKH